MILLMPIKNAADLDLILALTDEKRKENSKNAKKR